MSCTGDSTGKYAGVLDCFVKTARNDGLLVSPACCICFQCVLPRCSSRRVQQGVCMRTHLQQLHDFSQSDSPTTSHSGGCAAIAPVKLRSYRWPSGVCMQAFYNGFLPNFARLGSWNVAMFLMLEQVRRLAALTTPLSNSFTIAYGTEEHNCLWLTGTAAKLLLVCALLCALQMKVVMAPKD